MSARPLKRRGLVDWLRQVYRLPWVGLVSLFWACAHHPPPVPPGPAYTPAKISAPSIPAGFQSVLLNNGLRVSLLSDRSQPDVAVRLFYHVGSADEAADQHGIAERTAPALGQKLVDVQVGAARSAVDVVDAAYAAAFQRCAV